MTKEEKILLFPCYVWGNAIGQIIKFSTGFVDEFGSFMDDDDYNAREDVLDALSKAEHIMCERYEEACKAYLNFRRQLKEEKHEG